MGTACDMFSYDHVTKTCDFMPHNPVKGVQNLRDIVQKASVETKSVTILNCATPQENLLKNNAFFTHSYYG